MERRLFLAAAVASPLYAELSIFSASERALLDIVVEEIIPGVARAGAVKYLELQLAGPLARALPLYRENLNALLEIRDLPSDHRVGFLQALERGKHGRGAAELFATLIDHVMQSFYGDPKHGGNSGGASWKLMGIENFMGDHGH